MNILYIPFADISLVDTFRVVGADMFGRIEATIKREIGITCYVSYGYLHVGNTYEFRFESEENMLLFQLRYL